MVALFLHAVPVAAQDPEASFREGVAAVRAGEPVRAIEHFEAARAAGLDTGALHFNLGVAYYRAGRIDDAESSFRRAADSGTMVAPAFHQLGRIAREQGEIARARDHFRRALDAAQTDALRRRARSALAGLAPARLPDFVYLSIGGGHDSNLALTPSDASGVSEESDAFIDALLVARWPIGERDYLRGSIYLQEFVDEDDFSLTSLRGGIGRRERLASGWRRDIWIDGRHREFGGRAFDNSLLAGAEWRRPLNADWSLALDYRLELTGGAGRFDFLDGTGHRLAATLDERGRGGWRLRTWLATNDRDDRETADDFFSFSWTGAGFEVGHGRDLDDRHRLDLRADGSRRDYDGTEVRDGARPGTREDDLYGLEAAIERRLEHDWTGRLSLRVERRDSSLPEFDYDREVIRLVAERIF